VADRAGIRWIWAAGHDPLQATLKSVFVFHTTVKLKEKPKDAALFVLARGDFKSSVNGRQVGAKHQWHEFDRQDEMNPRFPPMILESLVTSQVLRRPPEVT
jgi:hypothetical protein